MYSIQLKQVRLLLKPKQTAKNAEAEKRVPTASNKTAQKTANSVGELFIALLFCASFTTKDYFSMYCMFLYGS